MAYTYKEIAESDIEHHVFINEEDYRVHEIEDMRQMQQFEILDEQGDRITIVYSEIDAEALISHLNR